jgi:hypothetical protein
MNHVTKTTKKQKIKLRTGTDTKILDKLEQRFFPVMISSFGDADSESGELLRERRSATASAAASSRRRRAAAAARAENPCPSNRTHCGMSTASNNSTSRNIQGG